ncbi:MAG: efflux RND transporter permease subunit, partial [Oceanipulchritudo sp.]
MHGFLETCLNRGRTILLILALILITGSVSYITIPKEAQPDITVPYIYVSLHHEGISPEDAERLLVRPMEQELRGLDGLKEMSATAYESGANLILEFEAGLDIDPVLNDVREKVDIAKADLPEETDEPIVSEINLALEPVIVVSLSGNIPERRLVRLAKDLRDEIESISEVLEVEIGGDREEVVELVIDPRLMETYGLSLGEISQMARRNNILVAAGNLDNGNGRIPVKVPGLFETPADILDLPIKTVGDTVIRTRDIATIRPTFKDPAGYSRLNGKPALTLYVKKRVGENVIETVEKVRELVGRISTSWPPGVQVEFSQDQSEDIKMMLKDLQNNVLSAIILVMIVCVAALGVRSGLLVGLAIPGSFLTGMLTLNAMGLTVNIVVLFSLILAVGMLVDGAIVVVELADRKMNEGLPRSKAYLIAAQRMALPIISSTATTLAAFLPLLFWPGIVGEFMKFLPITLIATLSASLLMALIFVPTVGALIGKPGPASHETMRGLAAAEGGDLSELTGFTGWYVRMLRRFLKHPGKLLLAVILAFFGVQIIYGILGKGVEFFPEVDPEFATILVRMRGNLSVDEMDEIVRQVEERIYPVEGIKTITARSNISFQGDGITEDTHGLIQLEFKDWQDRPPGREILHEIAERTKDFPGIIIEQRELEAGPPTGKDVQIEISSHHPELLEGAIRQVREYMETVNGLKDIDDSRPVPGVEWQVRVDRAQASRFGADISLVGSYVQFVTNGLLLGTYRPDGADDEVDIRARFPASERDLDQIRLLRLTTSYGSVPVTNFIEWEPASQVGEIHRVDGRRFYTVTANVGEGVLTDTKVRELRQWVSTLRLPDGLIVRFRGEDEEQKESMAFLSKAFFVAIFIMAIILVTQFNSFFQALLVLTAVIFSTIGVFIGLLITGQPFGVVMNGIGVIALAGIVVNNNIVLIDTFDYHRKSGAAVLEAVLRTGAQRLRPVVLTTVTTVLGLLPMVLRLNIDFIGREVTYNAPSTQWWVQLATSVAFGLLFATFLTLILTPSMLVLGDNISSWRRKFLHPRTELQASPEHPALVETVMFYRTPFPDPLIAARGTRLHLHYRADHEPGWVCATSPDEKEGWVPEQWLHIEGNRATLLRDY